MINLHVDFELQKNYQPGYPVIKRGVYYGCRKLSAQLDKISPNGKGYKYLEKVYSIWICLDRIPKKLQNTVSYYKITNGEFDTISDCKYPVPSYLDIGKLYSIMIEDCAAPGEEVQELINIFSSFISDEISRFQTDLYYQNPDYIECSYREGKLLD